MIENAGHFESHSPGDPITGKIACRCGRKGSAIWETAPRGVPAVPIEASDGFYLRIQKKNVIEVEIACAACGRAVRRV